jgi:hypothetical protein
VTRQLALPIGRDQAEAIPPMIAPCMHCSMSFEDHMVDVIALQEMTHGQTGLSAADDNHRMMRLCH